MDDEDVFYGYVETTVDPGPVLLIITIVVSCLLLFAVLPISVIVGDKRERRLKRINETAETDESAEDEQESGGDDSASASSSGESYYSALSGALRGALDQHGKVPRSRPRRRRRNRGRRNKKEANDEEGETGPSLALEDEMEGGKKTPSELSASENELLPDTGKQVDNEDETPNNCLSVEGFLDELGNVMAYDAEMRRIIKLSGPFAASALYESFIDILSVAVVGKLIGTREVSAYVIVDMLVEVTSDLTGGSIDALTALCSQAIGAKDYELAGKYVQIATVLYLVLVIPFMIFWVLKMGAAMEWFGFDAETVRIGQQYTYILVVDYWFEGISESIDELLDLTGHETYSTILGIIEETFAFLIFLVWALVGSPSLFDIALVEFFVGIFFLALHCAIIHYKGWFRPFRRGLVGSFALTDLDSVKVVFKAGIALSIGDLLTDGEWEILTLFASFLGPAEVVAWGILGTVWDGGNDLIEAIADASEVRCAYLLGAGRPEHSKLSAYKSMVIGVFTALFMTSLLFLAGDDLATWLTNDPALQHLLQELLPLFGLGNACMAMGEMAWALLTAQKRYTLATVVVGIGSWFVTIPLAAFLTIYLNLDLQGLAASVVIGYISIGTIHTHLLFRSDWAEFSQNVISDEDDVSKGGNDERLPDVAKSSIARPRDRAALRSSVVPENKNRRDEGVEVELGSRKKRQSGAVHGEKKE